MKVGILTLGAANSRSIAHALCRAGVQPQAVDRPSDIDGLAALVIPGVANLGYIIAEIDRSGWRDPLTNVIASGTPTLGICAGFQLLFRGSEEAPTLAGLGICDGDVVRLRGAKVPHMGWNRVEPLTAAFESGWAYFAHSYAVPASVPATVAVTACTPPIASVAIQANVVGVQFHPERSGRYGAAFLERFVARVRETAGVG